MSAEMTADLSSERDMVLTRRFQAPRALVWQCWTDPAHLTAWWGPHAMSNQVDQNLAPGGYQDITMTDGEGNQYPIHQIVHEVVPEQRLVTEMRTDDMSEDWKAAFAARAGDDTVRTPRIVMTVTFEDTPDGGTLLTVRQTFESRVYRDANARMGAETGWRESFEKLDRLLSTTVTNSL